MALLMIVLRVLSTSRAHCSLENLIKVNAGGQNNSYSPRLDHLRYGSFFLIAPYTSSNLLVCYSRACIMILSNQSGLEPFNCICPLVHRDIFSRRPMFCLWVLYLQEGSLWDPMSSLSDEVIENQVHYCCGNPLLV